MMSGRSRGGSGIDGVHMITTYGVRIGGIVSVGGSSIGGSSVGGSSIGGTDSRWLSQRCVVIVFTL
jgi:hypothetical protein